MQCVITARLHCARDTFVVYYLKLLLATTTVCHACADGKLKTEKHGEAR